MSFTRSCMVLRILLCLHILRSALFQTIFKIRTNVRLPHGFEVKNKEEVTFLANATQQHVAEFLKSIFVHVKLTLSLSIYIFKINGEAAW